MKNLYVIQVLKSDGWRKTAKRSAETPAAALAKCPPKWLAEKPKIVSVEAFDGETLRRLPEAEWPEWPEANA